MIFDTEAYMAADPRMDWMEEEDAKRREGPEGTDGKWLWDTEEARDFIVDEFASDGKPYGHFHYAHWIALRMKFLKGKCARYAREYLLTKERDYQLMVGGKTIFQWLYAHGGSYPEAFLMACLAETDDGPEKYDPPWDYKAESGDFSFLMDPGGLRGNIVLLPDGKSYRRMTEEEREEAHPKKKAVPFPDISMDQLIQKMKEHTWDA